MITITENDFPIDVVAKLIHATKPIRNNALAALNKALGGNAEEDMFTDDDLLEIADYLKAYAIHNIYRKNDDADWNEVKEELPAKDRDVLVLVNGKFKNITFENSYQIASYSKEYGWIVEGFEGWEDPDIKYWMELPKVPTKLLG